MAAPFSRMTAGIALALSLVFITSARGADVIINEIMYHPPHEREGLQFIELFNAGSREADLGGWAFRKGVQFEFGKGTKLPAGGFVVVCRSRKDFVDRYSSDPRVAGEFTGKLSHGGERIELTDAAGNVVDAVKYSDQSPWPPAADGGSASLERICPTTPGAEPANWSASALPQVIASAGTPGRTNDSYSANLPPVISDLTLSPREPQPGQTVTVSAKASDADGVSEVTLLHRNFGTSNETALTMRRVDGDARSGRYEVTLPAQPKDSIVRYRLRAKDSAGFARMAPSTNDLRPAWSFGVFANTNTARIPFAFLRHGAGDRSALLGAMSIELSRGEDALVLMPSGSGAVRLFDFVRVVTRQGGFKVHFLNDDTLRGMTTVNVIYESSRSVLSEPMAFELYRLAGVPAPLAEHWRLWVDGRPRGYQLVFEQVNKSFLTRNGRDTSGHLYKLLWYGSGIEGQHERKTHAKEEHTDLLAVIDGLNATTNAAVQWEFIARHFNVTNFIDYYAVNMCIQNWDGFFNNYFTYHDTSKSGRWEIYPWDEDKTWGDYDGANSAFEWYSMPLTFGMKGDQRPVQLVQPGAGLRFRLPRGAMWWREPGHFSGPLLANDEFRQRFLARLRGMCETLFTPEKMNPLIDALEQRLEPEISATALPQFRRHIESFRGQVVGRRKFILEELSRTP